MKPYPLVELNHLTVPFTEACESDREPPLSKFAMCSRMPLPCRMHRVAHPHVRHGRTRQYYHAQNWVWFATGDTAGNRASAYALWVPSRQLSALADAIGDLQRAQLAIVGSNFINW